MKAIARLGVLALGAVGCGVISGLLSLYVLTLRLPPTDLAYGQSVFQSLHDPFEAIIFMMLVGVATLVGFVVSIWALWRVRLIKAIPIGIAVTASAAILGALISPPASAIVALGASIVYMVWCHGHQGWALPIDETKVEESSAP